MGRIRERKSAKSNAVTEMIKPQQRKSSSGAQVSVHRYPSTDAARVIDTPFEQSFTRWFIRGVGPPWPFAALLAFAQRLFSGTLSPSSREKPTLRHSFSSDPTSNPNQIPRWLAFPTCCLKVRIPRP